MNLPFTATQFFDVFAAYNRAIWPAQIIAYLMGIAALAFFVRPGARTDRIAGAALAAMWLWTGIAYHGVYFTAINPAGPVFAALFVGQGLLLAYDGVIRRHLHFNYRGDAGAIVGLFLVIYAAVLYPLIGAATSHTYPRAPMFGVTPCPVTIFTVGMLLLTARRPPARIWFIPVLWSFIGGSAAFLLKVPQDWLLLVSGILAIGLSARRAPRAP